MTLAIYLLPFNISLHAQGTGQLLITEVYYDTPGTDGDEEWVEITNTGSASLSLDGFKLGDEEQPGSGEGMARFPPGVTLQPQQSVVVAQTASGLRALFGINPDFEFQDSDAAIPDMLPYESWARGDFALNNDGDEVLLLDGNDLIVDAVAYGDSTVFMSPAVLDIARGQSIARAPAHCDTDGAGDWQPQNVPTPGVTDMESECASATAEESAPSLLTIGDIQGDGDSSPRINETVNFEGIVTGLLEDRNTRGAIFYTLFVQEIPGNEDGKADTSDAIAVFHGPRRPSTVPGDVIRVRGQVTEFYGFTEIDDSGLQIEILDTGHSLPPAMLLPSPVGSGNRPFEALEAMRVALPEAVVVGPTFSGCGFAVAAGAAPIRFVRQRLTDSMDEIMPILHISDITCGDFPQVKAGDVVHGLQGPLIYHFDQFKMVHQFTSELEVTAAAVPPLPRAPTAGENELGIATFNLHDFFDAVDDTRSDAEPHPAPEEVQIKQTKLAQTISDALGCPTVLAVQEVENEVLLQSLAQQLEPSCGFRYAVAHRESPDVRGIDLGLLVDPRRGQILSVTAEQRCSPVVTDLPEVGADCPAGQDPLFSRPPLQVDLLLDGAPYTVVVTHFKSKREGEVETAPRRLAQAEIVAGMVQRLMTRDPSARIAVLGDFNDYEQSATMALLTAEAVGLSNAALLLEPELRYTYNFGGVSQLLDSILLSPELASRLVSAHIIHVNADFAAAWVDDLQTVFRSSDHDIPLVVLRTADVITVETVVPPEETTIAAPPDSAILETATPAPTLAAAVPDSDTRAVPQARWPVFMGGLALGALLTGAVYFRRKRLAR